MDTKIVLSGFIQIQHDNRKTMKRIQNETILELSAVFIAVSPTN